MSTFNLSSSFATLHPRHSGQHPAHTRRELYGWFALLAILDVCFTSIILSLGGTELNALACWLFRLGGPVALAALKLSTFALVFVICETIARAHPRASWGVAAFAVVANVVPVTTGVMCLGMFAIALV